MASYGLLPDPDLRGPLWLLMAPLSPKPMWLLLPPAGINPASLRGTNTGVWVGVSGSEASEALSRDPETLLGYSMVGCQRAMMANRLSFFFDFKGGWAAQPWARAQLRECIHLDNPFGLTYSWGNTEWGIQGPRGAVWDSICPCPQDQALPWTQPVPPACWHYRMPTRPSAVGNAQRPLWVGSTCC